MSLNEAYLDHYLATIIRIGGEDLRTIGIHPVVGQRPNRIRPGRMWEVEYSRRLSSERERWLARVRPSSS
jgi:hypothetical protein